jgi:hypothetical protein
VKSPSRHTSNGHLRGWPLLFFDTSLAVAICAKRRPPPLSMARWNIPPSHIYRRTTTASTATMMTIAPTINQFRAVFRCLVARISCCSVSRVARCAAHRVSFSCWVSCGSAMVFSFAIRAGVVCGSCSLSHSLYLLSALLTIPLGCCHINKFRRASKCGAAMARRRKEDRRAAIASRGI